MNICFDVKKTFKHHSKNILLCLFLFASVLISFSCQQASSKNSPPEKLDYDVVVIGGGLAGLSTAFELKDLNVLILEKEERLGGRIFAKQKAGLTYDLGAVYAYPEDTLPFKIEQAKPIKNNQDVLFYHKQKMYECPKIENCLAQLDLSDDDKILMQKLKSGSITDYKLLTAEVRSITNGILRVTLPGELENYPLSIQSKIFKIYKPVFFPGGNGLLIEKFKEQIKADILLGAKATKVIEQNNFVSTSYLQDGKQKIVKSKAVVVTVPATIALKLIPNMPNTQKSFLASLQYDRYTIVSFGVSDDTLIPFSYMIPTEGAFNTILRFPESNSNRAVFSVFYGDKESVLMQKLSDKEIIEKTIKEIQAFKLGKIDRAKLLFSDVHRWRYGGHSYIKTRPKFDIRKIIMAGKNILLAGDYLSRHPLYGIESAIQSGKNAAKAIKTKRAGIKLVQK